jgi:hypothetical protein
LAYDRTTIKEALDRELVKLVDHFRSMSAEDVARPCTESEVPGADPWTPKDHITHLAMIERAFQGMIRRGISGDGDPVGLTRGGRSREEIMAFVHKGNEDNVLAHKADDLEALIADLEAARADTLALLDELTDEQLASPLKGAPWADGTIGGVLITNAGHQVMHTKWVDEGLAN